MKQILLIIFLTYKCLTLNAQELYPLKLIVEDNAGRTDTVLFGFSDEATLGIDSTFGEYNLYQKPFDSLEIRAIQRDSNSHHCLSFPFNEQDINGSENIDTKIDYRPREPNIPKAPQYINFEFIIHGYAYPINVSADVTKLGDVNRVSSLALLDSNCNVMQEEYVKSRFHENIFTISNAEINTLIFHWAFLVGIDDKSNSSSWQLFPNPTSGQFSIKDMDSSIDMISIIDTKGNVRVTKQINVHHEPFEMSISHLPNGIYIVQLRDLNSGDYSTQMLQKISP